MFKNILKRIIQEGIEQGAFDIANKDIDNTLNSNSNNEYNATNEYNDENTNNSSDIFNLNNNENKTTYDNLVLEDKTFSEAAFKAKVDNIFIQLYSAVMKQDLQRVKHFLSDEIFEKYDRKVKQLQENNQFQVYDELNVSDTNITNIEEDENEFRIHVSLLTKYLDYIIDKETRKFISGNKDVRTEKRVYLVFTKTKKAKELKSARTCASCGANVDINKTGVCPYCGSIFKLKDYDWVLTQIND